MINLTKGPKYRITVDNADFYFNTEKEVKDFIEIAIFRNKDAKHFSFITL